ncbi:M23 family metallopeptidase [Carboxydothermus pertinax]|uniref:M23/M37 peptidase domain-containing protein n=1 Tax=Carboxydothermus pertinax TaxID=870242 RepID=A0A1L8CT65_9THEO|nr:M23 family metallopeptidase [Carboxydothermus pertinax]GAV22135.1 M23/M37 peptidase domain-containing protein [Carboxydothermus pertinax]
MRLAKKLFLITVVMFVAYIIVLGNTSQGIFHIEKAKVFPNALLVSLEPSLVLAQSNTTKNQFNNAKVKKVSPKVAVKKTQKTSRKARLIASRDEAERFIWPARGGINSPFGERWGRMHEGIDIDGSTGDPVRASREGVVTFAGWEDGYGKLIVLDHVGPYKTKYGHLSKILVRVGQRVEAGEVIGLIGSTGRSTGSHLHFEILINGNPVNPLRYLP